MIAALPGLGTCPLPDPGGFPFSQRRHVRAEFLAPVIRGFRNRHDVLKAHDANHIKQFPEKSALSAPASMAGVIDSRGNSLKSFGDILVNDQVEFFSGFFFGQQSGSLSQYLVLIDLPYHKIWGKTTVLLCYNNRLSSFLPRNIACKPSKHGLTIQKSSGWNRCATTNSSLTKERLYGANNG